MKNPPSIYKAEPVQKVARFAGSNYEVRLSANKAGKPIAHYWQRELGRWMTMPRATAELLIVEGRATEV